MRSDWFFLVLVTFLTDNSLQSADKRQQEMRATAVAEKPQDAVVKFDTYQNAKCTAASRGSPCDSTALVT